MSRPPFSIHPPFHFLAVYEHHVNNPFTQPIQTTPIAPVYAMASRPPRHPSLSGSQTSGVSGCRRAHSPGSISHSRSSLQTGCACWPHPARRAPVPDAAGSPTAKAARGSCRLCGWPCSGRKRRGWGRPLSRSYTHVLPGRKDSKATGRVGGECTPRRQRCQDWLRLQTRWTRLYGAGQHVRGEEWGRIKSPRTLLHRGSHL